MSSVDIKYLNKDFTDLKAALIEYAKAYYPTVYNDFTTASPGAMFIDMAAYVGDVLSFYLDNQIQETFLQYAKQKDNLYALAYTLGYRPKVTSAATVPIDVYQLLPANAGAPDFDYALVIQDGMQISAGSAASSQFYIPEAINFAVSGSTSPTEISVYSVDGSGNPTYFLLKKTVQAISGVVKTSTFSFGQAQKFSTVTLTDTDIIEVIDAVDGDGNKWYEVPYLAQDTVLQAVANLEGRVPNFNSDTNQVPYFLQVLKTPRRFVTRFNTDNTLQLQFGPGMNAVADEAYIPNPTKVGIGLLDGLSKMNTAYDPTNFTTTYTYGLAPSNTSLTVRYLTGGGALANVAANSLTSINAINADFYIGEAPDVNLGNTILSSITVNNAVPATGGGDGDSIEEIKLNTLLQYPTQMRAVTQQDYLAHTYNMPSKFGQIAKAYVTKDMATFNNTVQHTPGVVDPLATTIYVLGFDENRSLTTASDTLKQNLKTYLSQYRMLTDTVTIKDAFIINLGLNFEVILRPNYAGREVLGECITRLKNYFVIDNWQINQPIILSDIYTLLDQVQGVQTVKKVEFVNKYGEDSGYSKYSYDLAAAKLNNVIYPSMDPSVFEIKYPNTDIRGKVVTY